MYREVFIVEHVYQCLDTGAAGLFLWEQPGNSWEQRLTAFDRTLTRLIRSTVDAVGLRG